MEKSLTILDALLISSCIRLKVVYNNLYKLKEIGTIFMLTKTQKVAVALSVVWSIISLILSGAIADESYSGFNIWAFLGMSLAFTSPVWLYWGSVWIFGAGFLVKSVRAVIRNWLTSLSVLWVILCAIGFISELSVSVGEAFLLLLLSSSPAWIYWLYLFFTRKKRHSETYQEIMKKLSEHHPWRRFWARWLDWFIFGTIVMWPAIRAIETYAFSDASSSILSISSKFEELEWFYSLLNNVAFLAFLNVILWIPIESLFLKFFGTTPGKLLFGISIKTDTNDKLSIWKAFRRSLSVAGMGSAFGLPVFNLFFFYSAYQRLKNEGVTHWDKKFVTVPVFVKLHPIRKIVASFFVVGALLWLSYLHSVPTDDYTKYQDDTISVGLLQQEMANRADRLWFDFNNELERIKLVTVNTEFPKTLSLYNINASLLDRQNFVKNISESKSKLIGNVDKYENDLLLSNIQPGYKKSILDEGKAGLVEVKKLIEDYLIAVEKENAANIELLEYLKNKWADVSVEGEKVLFSAPQDFDLYKTFLSKIKTAEKKTYETKYALLVFSGQDTDDLAQEDEQDQISKAYLDIRLGFEKSPYYELMKIVYGDDPSGLENFYREYAALYVREGDDKAANAIRIEMANISGAVMEQSLPSTSNSALYDFAKSFVSISEDMRIQKPDLCPMFYSGVEDYSEFGNFLMDGLDEKTSHEYFKAIANVITSAKKSPGQYTFEKAEIEKQLEAPMIAALISMGDKAQFVLDGTQPEDPQDGCLALSAIYGEILKLKSPLREDILRHMLTFAE